jgi:hypothetical protein
VPIIVDPVCQEHTVERKGYGRICSACEERLVSTCANCSVAPLQHRYADGLGACGACHRELDGATRGLRIAPTCGHRYWVRDLEERVFDNGRQRVVERPGRMCRCDWGLNFTREAAPVLVPA